jgi:hypothetical protein
MENIIKDTNKNDIKVCVEKGDSELILTVREIAWYQSSAFLDKKGVIELIETLQKSLGQME